MINLFKRITFYETPQEMPLYNFVKYLETQDLRYFTKEHKEHKNLEDVMTNFYGLYLELSNNRQVYERFGRIHKILNLKNKYDSVMLILYCLYNYDNDDIDYFNNLIEGLEGWNYRIDRNREIFKQLENIGNRVQGLKSQIALHETYLKEEDQKEVVRIESQLISVTRVLELGYKLDQKAITVAEWIEYQNQANEVISKLQRNN